MEFIESWFHVAPDTGDGTLEFALMVIPLLALVILLVRGVRARRLKRAEVAET